MDDTCDRPSREEIRGAAQYSPENVTTETTLEDDHRMGKTIEKALVANVIPFEEISKLIQFSPTEIKTEVNSVEDYHLGDVMKETEKHLAELTPHNVSNAVNFVVSSTEVRSDEEDTLSDYELSVSSFLECQLEILHSNEINLSKLENNKADLHSSRGVPFVGLDGEHSINASPISSTMKRRSINPKKPSVRKEAKTIYNKKETGPINYDKIKKDSLESRTCFLCEKVFTNISHLKIHNRIHTGEKPFECRVCHKSFRQKCHLVDHERLHLNDPAAGKSFVCSLNGCYTCIVCGKVFQGSWKIESHLRVHTGEKPYHCDICSKNFKQKGHLSDHKKIHSEFKEFKCSVCPKEFYSSKTKAYHELKTHGEKNHVCSFCGHAFSRKCDLATHLRTHS